ncbi:MAG: hypothetical protein DRO39_08060 [Thermoprotei archaeon]|nr:MAG: hypothetical protein DRO39_08060 [Thermoprotei archaeon]
MLRRYVKGFSTLMGKELVSVPREIALKNGRILKYLVAFFEPEERATFEIRVLTVTHRLSLEGEGKEQVDTVRKVLEGELRALEKSYGDLWRGANPWIEPAPMGSLGIRIWSSNVFADIAFIDRRLRIAIRANNVEPGKLRGSVEHLVESLLKTLAEHKLMEETPVKQVLECIAEDTELQT